MVKYVLTALIADESEELVAKVSTSAEGGKILTFEVFHGKAPINSQELISVINRLNSFVESEQTNEAR